MTLTLTLSTELEEQLSKVAKRARMPLDEYAMHILKKALPPQDYSNKLKQLFQSWIDEDNASILDEEVIQMLEQDRLSNRKLFPPELKGISW